MHPLLSAVDWRTCADILLVLSSLASLVATWNLLRENRALRIERRVSAEERAELERWRKLLPPEKRLTQVWRWPGR
jgi:type II secretory pathway component PulL